MRNPDENLIIPVEAPATRDMEVVPAKVNVKQIEDIHLLRQDVIPNKKTQEIKGKKSSKVVESRAKAEDPTSIANSPEIEKPQEAPKPNEIYVAKLKEMRREEEIAKAKLASERKKKQAEKVAAKATVKAQKESEKKLKEKEKRLKKEAGESTSAAPTEEPEVESKVSEPENVTVDAQVPVAKKSKGQKENNARFRNRPTERGQVPKITLKRKKASSYWIWVAPTTVAAVLLAATAYYYLSSA